jgi:hypothetical protein
MNDAVSVALQHPSPAATVGDATKSEPTALSDNITVSDFTRIALMILPQDKAEIDNLQLLVTSGEYGPPATTIAEALIERSLFGGSSLK